MKNAKLSNGSYAFVLGNDRKVTEARIVDNARWGEGYVVIETEDGRQQIADSDRCFSDPVAAQRAADSDRVSAGLIG